MSAPLPRHIGETTRVPGGSITRLPERPAVLLPGQRLIEVQGTSGRSPTSSYAESIAVDPVPINFDDDMAQPVTFNGRPTQLDDVITHVTIKFLTDPTL